MPAAAVLDAILQRYGWSYEDYMGTPESVIQELLIVMQAESQAQSIREARQSGRTGGDAAVPENRADLLRQAQAAGLPLPPS